MQVREFQRAARTTAIYPAAAGFYYPALGLAGELGELANKAKKIIRGDFEFESRKEDFKKELGDVLWYVAAIASDLGLNLEEVSRSALLEKLYIGDLYSTLLRLQGQAGRIAEIADDARTHGLLVTYRTETEAHLSHVLTLCARLCTILDADLGEVCKDNIKKLFKRKETGTIKGDGDNREQALSYRIQRHFGDLTDSWEDVCNPYILGYDKHDLQNTREAAMLCYERDGHRNQYRIIGSDGQIYPINPEQSLDYSIQSAKPGNDWCHVPNTCTDDLNAAIHVAMGMAQGNTDHDYRVIDGSGTVHATF